MRNLLLAVALAGAAAGAARASAEEAVLLGSFVWTSADPRLGGISGLELEPDGVTFIAISDRAVMFRGTLRRGAGGAVEGVEIASVAPLLDQRGEPLAGARADAEGLALAGDGRLWISFEGIARIRIEDRGDGLPDRLPSPREFEGLQPNAGLEALAVDAAGNLYAIPERSGRAERPFPVFRWDGAGWSVPFTLARRGPWLVSGADVGPDGRLYVLERDFNGLAFRSRIRSVLLDGRDERTHLETGFGRHDNLEGIAVWQDARGIRITLVSDDNFRLFQRTELVDYLLPVDVAGAAP